VLKLGRLFRKIYLEDAFKKLGYDLFYLKHKNLFLTLKILAMTPLVALTGWGARSRRVL